MSIGQLTRAEREVVVLLAQGLSNREIGAILWRTEQTVKFHITNVLKRFGFRNRTEVAVAYVRSTELAAPWPEANGYRRRTPGLCAQCGDDPPSVGDLCGFCNAQLSDTVVAKEGP